MRMSLRARSLHGTYSACPLSPELLKLDIASLVFPFCSDVGEKDCKQATTCAESVSSGSKPSRWWVCNVFLPARCAAISSFLMPGSSCLCSGPLSCGVWSHPLPEEEPPQEAPAGEQCFDPARLSSLQKGPSDCQGRGGRCGSQECTQAAAQTSVADNGTTTHILCCEHVAARIPSF